MENNNTPAALRKFIVGQTYVCRSVCDYDCKWTFTVTARTEKSVTLSGDFMNPEPKTQTKRLAKSWPGDESETIMPFGRFSMAPALRV